LEEAEAKYIETLRKARPDLAEQVHYAGKRVARFKERMAAQVDKSR
jgi:hypothetical protein